MRKALVALVGCLLVVAAARGLDATPAPTATVAAAGGIQYEDPGLPDRERELLAHYARAVGRWAMVQRVVQAVGDEERDELPMERVRSIDAAWRRGEDPEGLAGRLAKNECAQALQTLLAANPGYGDAFVVDDRGALVCMSQRIARFWQGDDPRWIRAFAGGAGAVFVSTARHDQTTGLDLAHISVPVRVRGRVIGVLVVGRIVAPGL